MEAWITGVIEQFGYIGVFLLIMIENIFPPIPSEVILTLGGFMTSYTSLTIFGVIITSTLGSVAGAIVLYGVGRLIDFYRIEWFVEKWGHFLRLTKQDTYKANDWFTTYGVWTVFLCRFIPLIRSLISLPAGMAHMNMGIFLILTVLGTFVWNGVLVIIGAAVGESWETIVKYMDIYSNIVYVLLAVLLIAFITLFILKRFK
ncbi:MAG TPA: DedA family protein [Bacillota bacterium]|nr:DedA family protein [Bacillota bacterium]